VIDLQALLAFGFVYDSLKRLQGSVEPVAAETDVPIVVFRQFTLFIQGAVVFLHQGFFHFSVGVQLPAHDFLALLWGYFLFDRDHATFQIGVFRPPGFRC